MDEPQGNVPEERAPLVLTPLSWDDVDLFGEWEKSLGSWSATTA